MIELVIGFKYFELCHAYKYYFFITVTKQLFISEFIMMVSCRIIYIIIVSISSNDLGLVSYETWRKCRTL